MLPASAAPSNSASVRWVRMPAVSATSASRSAAMTSRSPGRARAPVADLADLDQAVGDVGTVSDGAVGRDGPRRRGPDHHGGACEIRPARLGQRKADPDRGAGVVVVLDLGLGQRGLLDHRPHHRLLAAVECAREQELAELAVDAGLGREVHGGVGVVPVAEHAQALELGALDVDPALRELAALAAEVDDRDRVLVLALLAVLLLDLPLDRQAVAVPAGHVGRVLAQHLLAAVDHVLEDLVERRAHVEMAVGIRRPVVQHELRPPGRGLAQAVVEVGRIPAGDRLGLALGQVRLHREVGARQEDRVAVVGGHGGRELRREWGRGGRGPARSRGRSAP